MTGGDNFETTLLVALPGDVDLDGDIDNNDIQIILLANKFGIGPSDATWGEGDFDGDDDVDNDDIVLILLTNAFGSGSYAATDSTETDSTLSVTTSSDDEYAAMGAALSRLSGGHAGGNRVDAVTDLAGDPLRNDVWDAALEAILGRDDTSRS